MDLKALIEKRTALIAELDTMVKALTNEKGEVRAFTDDEMKDYNAKKAEVDSLTATIKAIQETRAEDITVPADGDSVSDVAESEEKRAADEDV